MRLKPRVLVFVDWFLPGYRAGGPIKSVANIVQHLKQAVDFSIVTGNTDLGVAEPYSAIKANVWLQQDGYKILYLDMKHQKLNVYRNVLQEANYDTLYFNSLFSLNFTLLPLLAKRMNKCSANVILAPRGMLGQGALSHKKNKKKLFIAATKWLGLFENITWHASTALEAHEIKDTFGENTSIRIAQNVATGGTLRQNLRIKTTDNTAFFYLSRISPKKNLKEALELLTALRVEKNINFTIIGPVEDLNYWKNCQLLIERMPENICVNYIGAIPNHELPAILKDFHFMFLPTYSENYGHVIIEAWENGCPVIISDQTPWQDLQDEQVGWDIPLKNKSEFIEVLEHCIAMEDEEYQFMSKSTQVFLKKYVVTPDVIHQNKALFSISDDKK